MYGDRKHPGIRIVQPTRRAQTITYRPPVLLTVFVGALDFLILLSASAAFTIVLSWLMYTFLFEFCVAADAVNKLLVFGDFTPEFGQAFGINEDHWALTLYFDARIWFLSLFPANW